MLFVHQKRVFKGFFLFAMQKKFCQSFLYNRSIFYFRFTHHLNFYFFFVKKEDIVERRYKINLKHLAGIILNEIYFLK